MNQKKIRKLSWMNPLHIRSAQQRMNNIMIKCRFFKIKKMMRFSLLIFYKETSQSKSPPKCISPQLLFFKMKDFSEFERQKVFPHSIYWHFFKYEKHCNHKVTKQPNDNESHENNNYFIGLIFISFYKRKKTWEHLNIIKDLV